MNSTPTLALTHIRLRVADLARSVEFYRLLGFVVSQQTNTHVDLSPTVGAPSILTLTADPTAVPAPRDAAGLFHAALLFPSRAALGAWLRHAAEAGVEFDGFSDHGVSEAIYFTDPESNGLEFYSDRPASQWPRSGDQIAMTTRALDVQSLLAAGASLDTTTPLAGAHWGHLHLRVTDLARSEQFYRDQLGVILTQGTYPGARFLAADGYHHHLGLNSWGHPRRPQPTNALGLAAATFRRTTAPAQCEQRDPDGIALRIVTN